MLLEGHGFKVIGTASNGQEGVNKIKSAIKKPDIILMDYRMPIKDGIEATREIIQTGYRSKIIFATADGEIKEEALKMGAFNVVKKPFDFNMLLSSINEALNDVVIDD